MPRLERLNLYANAGVTDASVDALAGIASLRRLDVWQTGITDAGIARLRQRGGPTSSCKRRARLRSITGVPQPAAVAPAART